VSNIRRAHGEKTAKFAQALRAYCCHSLLMMRFWKIENVINELEFRIDIIIVATQWFKAHETNAATFGLQHLLNEAKTCHCH
jgi:poly-D-alanine transfer protein DltD